MTAPTNGAAAAAAVGGVGVHYFSTASRLRCRSCRGFAALWRASVRRANGRRNRNVRADAWLRFPRQWRGEHLCVCIRVCAFVRFADGQTYTEERCLQQFLFFSGVCDCRWLARFRQVTGGDRTTRRLCWRGLRASLSPFGHGRRCGLAFFEILLVASLGLPFCWD